MKLLLGIVLYIIYIVVVSIIMNKCEFNEKQFIGVLIVVIISSSLSLFFYA